MRSCMREQPRLRRAGQRERFAGGQDDPPWCSTWPRPIIKFFGIEFVENCLGRQETPRVLSIWHLGVTLARQQNFVNDGAGGKIRCSMRPIFYKNQFNSGLETFPLSRGFLFSIGIVNLLPEPANLFWFFDYGNLTDNPTNLQLFLFSG